jgi:signal peptidase II
VSPNPKERAVSYLGAYAYALAAITVMLDQLSKTWAVNVMHLGERGPVQVLPFFRLTLVENRGVSFGLLRADSPLGRWALVAGALAVVIALIVWVRKADRLLFAAAVGLVIGGALGNNLIDRIRIGRVIDFLDFSGLYFPWVFNVADSAISVGVALLVLDTLTAPKGPSGAA